jgi:enterochelin esterase-like enzyme
MKKLMLFIFVFGCITTGFTQSGEVFNNLSLKSKILNTEKKYAIYLPPDYESSEKSYPVLYLLHGSGGNQTTWAQNGNVKDVADKLINEGIISPMIIVMPDASGAKRGYLNFVDGSWPYEDFFFGEFIPFIDKTYRTKPEKKYRAVAGLSMGGKGTFIYALHHPEMFAAACPLSIGSGPESAEEVKSRYSQMNIEASDKEYEDWHQKYDIIGLINQIPDNKKNAVRWYISIGDDDLKQYEGSCLIHIAMRKKEIPHEYRIYDGEHNWIFWSHELPTVLEFVTESFQN